MSKLLVLTTVLTCFLQGYLFLDRSDIINEFQPILIEKAANFTQDFTIAKTEYNIVIQETLNNTLVSMANINSRIAGLKADIVTAKNISANNSQVLACITRQDAAVAKLTSQPLNYTCYQGVSYPEFVAARDALGVLAGIPNNTITACQTLDPLPSQDDLFLECITDKILDLDTQTEQLKATFNDAKNVTIMTDEQCLADQSALITSQINEINFQVTLCLSLGK